MEPDEVLTEVWANRDAYAKQFNYDIKAIVRDLQEREKKNNRTLVSFPPKRVEKPTPKAAG